MLENDLNIAISLDTKAATVASFSRALIFNRRATADPGSLFDTTRIYSDPDDMLADGYTTTDPEYKQAVLYTSQEKRAADFAVFTTASSGDLITSLNLAKSEIEFYAVLSPSRAKSELHGIADWVLANEKLFIGSSSDLTVLTDRSNIREAYFLHSDEAQYADSGICGLVLPEVPGSVTWKWQEVAGITTPNFSATQLNQIRTANGQTFEKVSGYLMSNGGITTGGQFIDIIQIRDYAKARMYEAIIRNLRGGTTGMDADGISVLVSSLRQVLDAMGRAGQISPVDNEDDAKRSDMGQYQYKITVPEITSLTDADRLARKYMGLAWTFRARGKMHEVDIQGRITG